MTTPQLRTLYFPAWNRAAKAMGWTLAHGRLVADLAAQHATAQETYGPNHRLALLIPSLITTAQGLASRNHRAPTPQDLRHAAHLVTLGRDKSSHDLTNAELDSLLALFNLITDPLSLDAITALENPDLAARRRLEWFIKNRCLPAYVATLCRSEYRTPDWHDLSFPQLQRLVITLKNRPNAQVRSPGFSRPMSHKSHPTPPPMVTAPATPGDPPETDDQPF